MGSLRRPSRKQMMRRHSLIIWFAFFAEAHTITENSVGKLVGKLVDELVDTFVNHADVKSTATMFRRVLKVSPLHHADVENTTLGKPGQLKMPSHTSVKSLPILPASRLSARAQGQGLFPSHPGRYPKSGEPFASHSGRRPPPSDEARSSLSRRDALVVSLVGATALAPVPAIAREAEIPSLKTTFKDFTSTPSGLLYKDVGRGNGKMPDVGDRCVIDWTGYVNDNYGPRPFETKKLTEVGVLKDVDGGDKAFLRFELGKGSVIPAIEEGIAGMAEGGLRQLIVERPELGYPTDDPSHDRVGPKPSSFSGQRSLQVVLENQYRADKTLFFNIKLMRVDKPGENGWKSR